MPGPLRRFAMGVAEDGLGSTVRRTLGYLDRNYAQPTRWGLYRARRRIPGQQRAIEALLERESFALVILDGCRFDYFREAYGPHLEGDLERRWSPANKTPLWVPQVWPDEYDLTYVSSNPYVSDLEYTHEGYTSPPVTYRATDHFAEILDVWNVDWDPRVGTVRPESITEVALSAAAECKRPRLVVHYLQPHQPYVGEKELHESSDLDRDVVEADYTFEEKREFLESTTEVTRENLIRYDISWGEAMEHDLQGPRSRVRRRLESGEVSVETLRQAYRDNLELVLGEVKRLVARLDCRVVVTADHGDMLGEGGRFMHLDVDHRFLREVPWFTVDQSLCGRYEPESLIDLDPYRSTSVDDSAKARLRDLGYVQI